jgi:hypothetical protein
VNNDERSRIWQVAKAAGRSAIFFASGLLVLLLVFGKLGEILAGRHHPRITLALEAAAIAGAMWFCSLVLPFLVRYRTWAPSEKLLDHLAEGGIPDEPPFPGFVAMEYYSFILNRTFVVFCLPEGLYGWKAQGPVSNANPAYFHPYLALLDAPALMRSRDSVYSLAKLPGGFVIPRSSIASAEFDPSSKWGMGGIPHSGKIKIRLTSGRSRELVLLGRVRGEKIRDQIFTGF